MITNHKSLSNYLTLAVFCLILISCNSKKTVDTRLVLTEAPGKMVAPDYLSGVSWRYLSGARISTIIPNNNKSHKILTGEFYSAAFPDISYDGKFMLFAGQKKQSDTWQIWEMNLGNRRYRQITSSSENCTDPAYLPGGRLVFSKLTVNDTVKNAHCLYTCNNDGSGMNQITFSPQSVFATSVLKDGRLLGIGARTYPRKGVPFLMVMRPDGTKADMFYRDLHGNRMVIGRACESDDGTILFAESGPDPGSGSSLVSIDYNRPLDTRTELSLQTEGEIIYGLPYSPEKLVVSCRKPGSERFSVFEFDLKGKTTGKELYADSAFNVIEIKKAAAYQRPKKLPSEVDNLVKTGLLLCQDVNFRESLMGRDTGTSVRADKIEILGVDSIYGIVPVEKDGSFYLKILANKPFRIRALDEKGNPVGKTCSWLWLRSNERRGCVGCHEDPEFVPDNKVSLAIKKDPVIIPVHISDINEKIVELE